MGSINKTNLINILKPFKDILDNCLIKTNDKVSMIDARLESSSIEIYDSIPYIDFHFNNDTSADYTSRIFESEAGVLNAVGTFVITGKCEPNTLNVINNATINKNLTVNEKITTNIITANKEIITNKIISNDSIETFNFTNYGDRLHGNFNTIETPSTGDLLRLINISGTHNNIYGDSACINILGSRDCNVTNSCFSSIINSTDSNITNANYSSIFGHNNTIEISDTDKANNHNYGTFLFGVGHRATQMLQFMVGYYAREVTNALFTVGNGSSKGTSNVFRVDRTGGIYSSGALNTSGADYAEYFEWADGNTSNEDRRGKFVTLKKNKISIAKSGDYILGIVSSNAAVVGNAYGDQWQGMYLTDEWGNYITETVEVDNYTENGDGTKVKSGTTHTETRLKINPDYDSSEKYIPREDRQEWSPIGMLGQLIVLDDGTCEVDGYCTCNNNGIATKSTTGYRVIDRISKDKVLIIFK